MPRLGVGMPIIAGLSQEAVTTIDDFFFESNASGEVNPMLTTSRTNLIPHSQDFNSSVGSFSYVKINSATVTNNSTTAPDGTNTGALVTKGTNDLVLRAVNVVETGKTYTFSCFVKSSGSGVTTVSLDITDESFTTFPLTNDWQRISVTAQVTRTPLATYNFVDMATNGSQGDTFFTWGWQVEENGFISAYIPTSGSTVTVSTTLNDTSEVWDFDGTDLTLEADPEDEGFWEEGSNLVLNHDYEDLGSELVDFPNASMTLETGWSFTNGILTQDGSGAGQGASADANISNTSFDLNKQYKFTITVSSYTSGDLHLLLSPNTNVPFNINGTGEFTVYGGFYIDNNLHLRAGYGDFVGSISNLSIKQVDPNDRWSLGTSWSIEGGKLKNDGTNTGFQGAQQNNVTTVGDTYEVTVTVEATSGAVELKGNGVYTRIDSLGVGTHTFYIVADATYIRFLAHASATITLDNFTVREYAVQPKDI